MKIKISICYNGKNFVGWQTQNNGRSVQEEIEKTLSFLFDEKTKIIGSGRTDAGVHALSQVASFEISSNRFLKNFTLDSQLISDKLINAINANLPSDIKILSAEEVGDNFNARFSAKQKTYLYRLQVGTNPLTDGFVGNVNLMPDIKAMKKASKYLVGEHDFSSFCSSKTETKTFVRKIYKIKIRKVSPIEFNFEITGNGFLYNMVRIIVGTLYEVGIGKKTVKDIKTILDSKDRKKAGKTLPASGLYLKQVLY